MEEKIFLLDQSFESTLPAWHVVLDQSQWLPRPARKREFLQMKFQGAAIVHGSFSLRYNHFIFYGLRRKRRLSRR